MKRLLAIIAFCLSLSPAVAQFNGCGTGFCPSVFGSGFGAPSASGGPAVDLNFATAAYVGCTPATCLTIVRASNKTDLLPSSSSGLQFNTFTSNVLAITPTLGLLIEEARTNQLLNSCNATTYPTQCAGNTGPATQTTGSLAATAQTLWVNGSGSAALTNGTATGCTGTASQGSSVTFTPTAGTCIVTVTGSLNFFQLEAGSFGTSGIITTGAAGTRASDLVTLAGLAKTTIQGTSFSVIVQTGSVGKIASGILEGTIDELLRAESASVMRIIFGATVLAATLGSGTFTTTTVKSALASTTGARSAVANNGTVVSDTTNISANTSFFLGSFGNGSGFPNCYFADLTIFASKLLDATLQAKTQ